MDTKQKILIPLIIVIFGIAVWIVWNDQNNVPNAPENTSVVSETKTPAPLTDNELAAVEASGDVDAISDALFAAYSDDLTVAEEATADAENINADVDLIQSNNLYDETQF